jgi:endonuclease YncB( thermonuclease family)
LKHEGFPPLAFCGLYSLAIAAYFTGSVVAFLNDNTIEVLHNGKAKRIRLSGIDCSENGQVSWKKTKLSASEHVFGTEATLQTFSHNKYGRTIADVLPLDGTNLLIN